MPRQTNDKSRERDLTAARLRFEKATADFAAEMRFGGPDFRSTEIDIMDGAARLINDAKLGKQPPG